MTEPFKQLSGNRMDAAIGLATDHHAFRNDFGDIDNDRKRSVGKELRSERFWLAKECCVLTNG